MKQDGNQTSEAKAGDAASPAHGARGNRRGCSERSVRVVPVPDQGLDAVLATAIPGPFPRHVHRRLIVGLVDAGERIVAMDGAEHAVRAGQLFVIPPGRGHACRAGKGAHSYRLLCLPGGVHPALDAVRTPRVASPRAARLMDEFFAMLPGAQGYAAPAEPLQRTQPAYDTPAVSSGPSGPEADGAPLHNPSPTLDERERLLPALLGAVADAADIGPVPPPEPPHEGVRRVVRAIAGDPAAPHSLDDLAAVARLSKFHLHRLFVSDTGVSPADFRLHCRMGLALELLAKGTPLAETALACGFADQSHFTKAFSRAVGAPPGRFVRDNPPGGPARG